MNDYELNCYCDKFSNFLLNLSQVTKAEYNLNESVFSIKQIFYNKNYLFLKHKNNIIVPEIFQEELNKIIDNKLYDEFMLVISNIISIIEYKKYNI